MGRYNLLFSIELFSLNNATTVNKIKNNKCGKYSIKDAFSIKNLKK